MKLKSYYSAITIIFVMLLGGCTKGPVELEDNVKSQSDEPRAEIMETVLSVPESIPEHVDDIAVAEAVKDGFDGIRILAASSVESETKYLVSYFNDGNTEFEKELLIAEDGAIEHLNESERIYLKKSWEGRSLKKGAKSAFNICWELAEFGDGTYLSGTKFHFSQTTISDGWFHKIIYNLGSSQNCCETNYSGNLNDKISSH